MLVGSPDISSHETLSVYLHHGGILHVCTKLEEINRFVGGNCQQKFNPNDLTEERKKIRHENFAK